MKARIEIVCHECSKALNRILVDTADMPDELQTKINRIILGHRKECPFHSGIKRCDDCDLLYSLIDEGKASMMPAKCYPAGGRSCTFLKVKDPGK